MARRNLMHRNHLVPFLDWARGQGWTRAALRGSYEVLRLTRPGDLPVIVYERDGAPEHLTLQKNGERVFREFLRDRKAGREGR